MAYNKDFFMMTQEEYDNFWINIDDVMESSPDRKLISTLATHILRLQDRIDELIDPYFHDEMHGEDCPCYAVVCACAYDYPTDVCRVHKESR